MKKISILVLSAAIILSGSSCKKYLDVNSNPNQATSSTPTLVLPTTITYTASIASSYNDYGIEVGSSVNKGDAYARVSVGNVRLFTSQQDTQIDSPVAF